MNRGQAPLEFIIKYGGVLFIIIAIVITLSALGIFRFDTFLSPNCNFPTGITCLDYKISQTGLRLVLQNTFTQDITLTNIRQIEQNCTGAPVQLPRGKTAILTITSCRNGPSSSAYAGTITFTIETSHGATREAEASIRGNVQ